jgi:nucleotide-binding universal stress UspA family protein
MYHNILIALEGNPTDQAAIAHATALAQQDSAEVTLLQVITIASDDSGLRHLQMEPAANGWKRKNKADAQVAALQQQIQPSGANVQTAVIVSERSEADEIIEFASEGDYDLIVMAADGRPWWQRALFGCIADGVHHKTTVPTLLVSDGTRRQRVANKSKPTMVNPIFDSFGEVHIC